MASQRASASGDFELKNGNSPADSPNSVQPGNDVTQVSPRVETLDNQPASTPVDRTQLEDSLSLGFAEELCQVDESSEAQPNRPRSRYEDLSSELARPQGSVTDDNRNVEEEMDFNENMSPVNPRFLQLQKASSEESDSLPPSTASCTESTSLDSQNAFKANSNEQGKLDASINNFAKQEAAHQIVESERKHIRAPSISASEFDKIEKEGTRAKKSESLEVQPSSSRAASLDADIAAGSATDSDAAGVPESPNLSDISRHIPLMDEKEANNVMAGGDDRDTAERRESAFSLSDLPIPDFSRGEQAYTISTNAVHSSVALNTTSEMDLRDENDFNKKDNPEAMGPEITFRKASSVVGPNESPREPHTDPSDESGDGNAVTTLLSSSAVILESFALDDVVALDTADIELDATAGPSALARLLSSTARIAESVALPEPVAEAVAEAKCLEAEEGTKEESAISALLSNTALLAESVVVPDVLEAIELLSGSNEVREMVQEVPEEPSDAATDEGASTVVSGQPSELLPEPQYDLGEALNNLRDINPTQAVQQMLKLREDSNLLNKAKERAVDCDEEKQEKICDMAQKQTGVSTNEESIREKCGGSKSPELEKHCPKSEETSTKEDTQEEPCLHNLRVTSCDDFRVRSCEDALNTEAKVSGIHSDMFSSLEHSISTSGQALSTEVGEAGENIEKKTNEMDNKAEQTTNKTEENLQEMVAVVEQSVSDATCASSKQIEEVKGTAIKVKGGLVEAAKEATLSVEEEVTDLIDEAKQTLEEIDDGKDSVEEIVHDIKSVADKKTGDIKQDLPDISDNPNESSQEAQKVIGHKVQNLNDSLTQTIEDVEITIREELRNAKQLAAGVEDQLIDLAQKKGADANKGIDDAKDTFRRALEDIQQDVINEVSQVKEEVSSLMEKAQDLVDMAPDAVADTVSATTQIGGDVQAGKQTIMESAQKVKDVTEEIRDSACEFSVDAERSVQEKHEEAVSPHRSSMATAAAQDAFETGKRNTKEELNEAVEISLGVSNTGVEIPKGAKETSHVNIGILKDNITYEASATSALMADNRNTYEYLGDATTKIKDTAAQFKEDGDVNKNVTKTEHTKHCGDANNSHIRSDKVSSVHPAKAAEMVEEPASETVTAALLNYDRTIGSIKCFADNVDPKKELDSETQTSSLKSIKKDSEVSQTEVPVLDKEKIGDEKEFGNDNLDELQDLVTDFKENPEQPDQDTKDTEKNEADSIKKEIIELATVVATANDGNTVDKYVSETLNQTENKAEASAAIMTSEDISDTLNKNAESTESKADGSSANAGEILSYKSDASLMEELEGAEGPSRDLANIAQREIDKINDGTVKYALDETDTKEATESVKRRTETLLETVEKIDDLKEMAVEEGNTAEQKAADIKDAVAEKIGDIQEGTAEKAVAIQTPTQKAAQKIAEKEEDIKIVAVEKAINVDDVTRDNVTNAGTAEAERSQAKEEKETKGSTGASFQPEISASKAFPDTFTDSARSDHELTLVPTIETIDNLVSASEATISKSEAFIDVCDDKVNLAKRKFEALEGIVKKSLDTAEHNAEVLQRDPNASTTGAQKMLADELISSCASKEKVDGVRDICQYLENAALHAGHSEDAVLGADHPLDNARTMLGIVDQDNQSSSNVAEEKNIESDFISSERHPLAASPVELSKNQGKGSPVTEEKDDGGYDPLSKKTVEEPFFRIPCNAPCPAESGLTSSVGGSTDVITHIELSTNSSGTGAAEEGTLPKRSSESSSLTRPLQTSPNQPMITSIYQPSPLQDDQKTDAIVHTEEGSQIKAAAVDEAAETEDGFKHPVSPKTQVHDKQDKLTMQEVVKTDLHEEIEQHKSSQEKVVEVDEACIQKSHLTKPAAEAATENAELQNQGNAKINKEKYQIGELLDNKEEGIGNFCFDKCLSEVPSDPNNPGLAECLENDLHEPKPKEDQKYEETSDRVMPTQIKHKDTLLSEPEDNSISEMEPLVNKPHDKALTIHESGEMTTDEPSIRKVAGRDSTSETSELERHGRRAETEKSVKEDSIYKQTGIDAACNLSEGRLLETIAESSKNKIVEIQFNEENETIGQTTTRTTNDQTLHSLATEGCLAADKQACPKDENSGNVRTEEAARESTVDSITLETSSESEYVHAVTHKPAGKLAIEKTLVAEDTNEVVSGEGNIDKGSDAEKIDIEKATINKASLDEAVADATVEAVAVKESTHAQALVDEVSHEVAVKEIASEEANVEDGTAEQTVPEKATTEESVTEKSVAEKSAAQEIVVEEVAIERTAPDEAAVEKTVASEVAAEKTVAEEVAVVKIALEGAVAQDATGEKVVSEKVAIGEAVTKLVAAEGAIAKEVATYNGDAEEATIHDNVLEETAVHDNVPEETAADDNVVEETVVCHNLTEETAVSVDIAEHVVIHDVVEDAVVYDDGDEVVVHNDSVEKAVAKIAALDEATSQKIAARKDTAAVSATNVTPIQVAEVALVKDAAGDQETVKEADAVEKVAVEMTFVEEAAGNIPEIKGITERSLGGEIKHIQIEKVSEVFAGKAANAAGETEDVLIGEGVVEVSIEREDESEKKDAEHDKSEEKSDKKDDVIVRSMAKSPKAKRRPRSPEKKVKKAAKTEDSNIVSTVAVKKSADNKRPVSPKKSPTKKPIDDSKMIKNSMKLSSPKKVVKKRAASASTEKKDYEVEKATKDMSTSEKSATVKKSTSPFSNVKPRVDTHLKETKSTTLRRDLVLKLDSSRTSGESKSEANTPTNRPQSPIKKKRSKEAPEIGATKRKAIPSKRAKSAAPSAYRRLMQQTTSEMVSSVPTKTKMKKSPSADLDAVKKSKVIKSNKTAVNKESSDANGGGIPKSTSCNSDLAGKGVVTAIATTATATTAMKRTKSPCKQVVRPPWTNYFS